MTLTCRVGDQYVSVRTVVLRDADGNIITADAYQGKTIDVKGVVDFFSGDYQIKVFSASDITVK
jgi:DNA/RNA endonuclease YhcR with UshA esterase domain